MCGEDKPSVCERPAVLGSLGEAKTKPICDECYLEKLKEEGGNDVCS